MAQGAGAAAFTSSGLALVAGLFPEGGGRNRAIGVFSAAGAMGFAIGAIAGGLLTEAFGWHSAMLAPAVLVLPIVVLAPPAVENSRSHDRGTAIDLPGAALLAVGIGSLLYGLAASGENGWASPLTLAALTMGTVLLGGFLAVERRSSAPLVPLGTFRIRGVAAVTGSLFL